jgi:hypothetical protein
VTDAEVAGFSGYTSSTAFYNARHTKNPQTAIYYLDYLVSSYEKVLTDVCEFSPVYTKDVRGVSYKGIDISSVTSSSKCSILVYVDETYVSIIKVVSTSDTAGDLELFQNI